MVLGIERCFWGRDGYLGHEEKLIARLQGADR